MEKLELWKKGEIPLFNEKAEFNTPVLTPYIAENSKACIIVCPGGAYAMRAPHEGEGYAKWLMENGISSFVLDYRVAPHKYPAPQYDAMRAIRYARYYSEKYGYDKDKIGIMGSSAGGHLSGSVATASDEMGYTPVDEIDTVSCKPDFAVLCYPVISMNEFTHEGSRLNLLGEVSDETADKLSVHKRVTDKTPPMFIWHTSEDQAVPVENSLMLSMALSEKKIPFEFHSFQKGLHGLGLAEDFEGTKMWSAALLNWLKINGWK